MCLVSPGSARITKHIWHQFLLLDNITPRIARTSHVFREALGVSVYSGIRSDVSNCSGNRSELSIVPCVARCVRVFWESLGCVKLFRDSLGYVELFQESLGCVKVFWESLGSVKLFQESLGWVNYFENRSDKSKSSGNCSDEQNKNKIILRESLGYVFFFRESLG